MQLTPEVVAAADGVSDFIPPFAIVALNPLGHRPLALLNQSPISPSQITGSPSANVFETSESAILLLSSGSKDAGAAAGRCRESARTSCDVCVLL